MITYAGGLYWRKSKWNGRRCVPVILSVDAGRLRLSAAKEVAFDVPCAEATARFTKLGTMVLTVDGRQYDIVGVGASLSPNFTKEQRDELRTRQAKAASPAMSPGFAAGAAMDAVAIVGAVAEINQLRANIRPWRSVLPAAGVRVES